jgi:hypothetical protein
VLTPGGQTKAVRIKVAKSLNGPEI